MNKKVLIIDDDDAILDAIKLALEMEDYQVEISPTADNIEDKIKKSCPSVILLDILLSGNDGRNIAKRLKESEEFCKVPIVMMSAHPSAKIASKEAGADDFLPKPFDIDRLLNIVKKYTT